MTRAFVDVFPRTVLLSGTQAELLLVGTTGDRTEVDPAQLARTLETEPNVLADLKRIDLGSVKAIVGAFLASPDVLARATSMSPPVTDDRPLQEYSVARYWPPSATASPPRSSICPRRRNGARSVSTATTRRSKDWMRIWP